MIFSVIIILLVAAIAFFHYTQGFFSAALSAIIAIFAALLAVSYHEIVVNLLVSGPVKYAEQAHAMTLIALFALIYIVLRVLFDKMVPGNVRLNPTADKVGAGIMGLVAAIFSTGVFAIAAQLLPFGPNIAGYGRKATAADKPVIVPASPRNLDLLIIDDLASDQPFSQQPDTSMLLPVDEILLSMASKVSSENGSLAGARPFGSVHPDYLEELFGQRVGIQVGASRTALNAEKEQQVEVVGLYELTSASQAEGEIKAIRTAQGQTSLPSTIRPDASQMLLVVRTMIKGGARDTDNLFRFSPASVRLVANGQNFTPIGTLDNGATVLANRPDDYLFLDLSSDRGVDLVFLVDRESVVGGTDKDGRPTLAAGAFLEVKRMARQDLSGSSVVAGISADPKVGVIRKTIQ